MPIKRFSLLFLCLLFILPAAAQSSKETARSTIKQLKEGALFVRLRTRQNVIDAYMKRGRIAEAEILVAQQEQENKNIAAAFAKEFHFCKVYFFYSNHSDEVKAGNYAKHLMNGQLQPDTTYSGYYVVGEFDLSENTNLSAFIIKDKNYVPLKKPFPFLIKRNQMLVVERPAEDVAKLLDKKLNEFWLKP